MIPALSPLLALVLTVQADRPDNAKPAASPTPSAKASFSLKVRGGVNGVVDIKATQVETRAILDRLGPELKLPLRASDIVARHKVDVSLKEAPVVRLLSLLAPVVLADLEVNGNPEEVVWKAIHLLGYNEKEPSRALQQVGVLIAAGVTDDESVTGEDLQAKAEKEAAQGLDGEPKEPGKPMLAVVVKDGQVSIRARGQNLAALLNEVATRASVPFDIRGSVDPVPVDIEIRDLRLLDLPVALGRPGVRLVVRRNLATGEDIVQGILLGSSPAPY